MLVGVIVLCVNVARFLLGNVAVFRDPKVPDFMKMLNLVESVIMTLVLIVLLLNYYK
jgi:hypothetical protein